MAESSVISSSYSDNLLSKPLQAVNYVKVAGPVSCIAISSSDPEKLAIDCIDSILLRNSNCFKLLKSLSVPRNCISYIEWHPIDKDIIAFGCTSGKVGLLNANKGQNQVPEYFEEEHKQTVYSLAWGPCSKLSESSGTKAEYIFLYSCGGGKIYIHNIDRLEESFSLDDILKTEKPPYYTEFTWKSDFSQFAVGCRDGSLIIYEKTTFDLLFKLENVKGGVWSTRWHPKFTLSNPTVRSKYHNIIAVGTPEDIVHIYIVKAKKGTDYSNSIMKPSKLLIGHNGPINKIDWSPYIEGRLATCSKDTSVQVWDANKGELLVNFRGHEKNVLTVKWSLKDPDLIYSAGRDHRLISWRPSEQIETHPPEKVYIADKRRRKGRFRGDDYSSQFSNFKKEFPQRNNFTKDKERGFSKEKSGMAVKATHNKNQAEVVILEKQPTRKERKIKSLDNKSSVISNEVSNLPVDTSEIDDLIIDDVLNLFERIIIEKSSSVNEEKLIDINKEDKNEWVFDIYPTKALNTFFPKEEICEIFHSVQPSKKSFDLLYVAIAPMVSMIKWKKSCLSYSKMCYESSRNETAAFYKFILKDIPTATSIILKHSIQRILECYFISKYYLGQNNPVTQDYWNLLHQELEYHKVLEIKALLYISVNDVLSAASTLIEKNEPIFSRAASNICFENGFINEAKKYSYLCIKQSLISQNYEEIEKLKLKENIEWIVTVHKLVLKTLDSLNIADSKFGVQVSDIWTVQDVSEVTIWKSYITEGENFLSHIFHTLSQYDFKNKELQSTFLNFNSETDTPYNIFSPEEMMFHISLYICNFFYILHLDNTDANIEKAYSVMSELMSMCSIRQAYDLLNKIFILILPFDVTWNKNSQNIEFKSVISNSTESVIDKASHYLMHDISSQNMLKESLPLTIELFNVSSLIEELKSIHISNIIFVHFAANFIVKLTRKIEFFFYQHQCIKIYLPIATRNFLKCHHRQKMDSKVLSTPEKLSFLQNGDLKSSQVPVTNGIDSMIDLKENNDDEMPVTIVLGNLTMTVDTKFNITGFDCDISDARLKMCHFCNPDLVFKDSQDCPCMYHSELLSSILMFAIKLSCRNVYKINTYSRKQFIPKLCHDFKVNSEVIVHSDNLVGDQIETAATKITKCAEKEELEKFLELPTIMNKVKLFPDIYSISMVLKVFLKECENNCSCKGMNQKLKSLQEYVSAFLSQ